jgi:predicted phosphodiesterase
LLRFGGWLPFCIPFDLREIKGMRYLVFGDVHANAAALNTVLLAAGQHEVDATLFVGDLVGYGPQPLACIERLQTLHRNGQFGWVAGNHDLVARGQRSADGYIPEAHQTLRWTQALLHENPAAAAFLEAAPTTIVVDEHIWLTHDSLEAPMSGAYQRDLAQAWRELDCLRRRSCRVGFYGHTHIVRADLLTADGTVVRLPCRTACAEDFDAEPICIRAGDQAWIGTGSVGFPLNRERRAEFLILDTGDPELWRVEKYAAEYPRFRTRAGVHQELLPACSREVVEKIASWL